MWPGLRHDWQNALIKPHRELISDTGGSVCTWYFTPLHWRTAIDDRALVATFFDTYSLIETDKTSSSALLVHTRQSDATRLQVAKLVPRRKHDGYFLRSIQRGMGLVPPRKVKPALSMRSKWASGPLLWSAVLMRNDVLWLALCASPQLRADVAQLWHYHHVRNARGRRFQDAVGDVFIAAACEDDDVYDGAHARTRVRVRGAASWSRGAALEMVFRSDDAVARKLVSRLDRALAETTSKVVMLNAASGESAGDRAGGTKKKLVELVTVTARVDEDADAITPERVLRVSDDGADLILAPLPEDLRSRVFVFDDVHTWSEPLLRGILFTLTQLALVTQLGNAETRNAMSALSRIASKTDVNCHTLSACAEEDAREIHWHINAGRALTGR